MLKFSSLLLLALIFTSGTSFAQKPDWYLNFHNIMDNREYKPSVGTPRSILGARLDFAGGVKHDSVSGFYLGLNYLYEYGAPKDANNIDLNMYYKIDTEDFAFYVGSFEREGLVDFPLPLISDSILYYNPNVGGLFYEFRHKSGSFNVFVDWIGRKSDNVRESFIVGFSGKYQKGLFYIEDYAYMLHLARTSSPTDTFKLRDNGGGAIYAGIDLSDKTSLRILKADIGYVSNYDRQRPADVTIQGGVMGRASAHYKRIGADITSYWGDELLLPLGDKLYTNGNYTRIDLCAEPIVWNNVESVFKWSFHHTGGVMSHSQQLFVTVRF